MENTFEIKGFPLIKFQNSDKIESLRQGHLYAKTLKYYRQREIETGNDQIGDMFEGMFHINDGYLINKHTGEKTTLSDSLIPTEHSDDFVFCMFGIYPSCSSHSFTIEQKEKLRSFGDTGLIILDSEEFKSRVISAATQRGYNVHFDAVRYYEPSTDSANKMLSLVGGIWKIAYWKRSKYSYQQECRFLISPGNGDDHVTLEIGDISDITIVQPTETILSSIVKKKTT